MSDNLNEINALLDTANEKLTNVAADVAALHNQIGSLDAPTAEEWAATKEKIANLNATLTQVDEATPSV